PVVNLVLVDDLFSQRVGLAGQLPGPAGIYETGASGVVVDFDVVHDNPEAFALVLSHELGHFLGLRHTSETFDEPYLFGRVDLLDDTPECDDPASVFEACPDFFNLMFPLVSAERDTARIELSEQQLDVLARSPFVQ
ncbi:MAG: hypothetical protein KC561_03030, partial [Myxococcales bacterium]|nr:hypothetical protein [Myxococcales bacterium]